MAVLFLQSALIHRERYFEEWAYYYGGVGFAIILKRRVPDNGKIIDKYFVADSLKIAFPRIYPKWEKFINASNDCDPASRVIYEPTYKTRKQALVVIMNQTESNQLQQA